ncbi:hypothetical protein VDG1235_4226 [Verrucomicrobiia bacterium DG1235]|nr:hypothetical protein VDG1235_4226 [Verrucomicrobiae bacterium DG1235]
MTIPNTNDKTANSPRLVSFLNAGTLRDLPKNSALQGVSLDGRYQAIQAAGFTGVQDGDAEACQQLGLNRAGSGRINVPSEVEPLVESHLSQGFVASTLHVGWGTEDDSEVDKLLNQINRISRNYRYPLYIETHRATITQDSWRTVQMTKRFPDIRFNGDFSHWYTGHEMVYGDWNAKLEFIKPVLDRVRFLHGRIATPGAIQAPLSPNPQSEYIAHFRQIWQCCFTGFLASATTGDYLIFAPELLPPSIYYAQTHLEPSGAPQESSDRWQDALFLKQIAEEEFANARANRTH